MVYFYIIIGVVVAANFYVIYARRKRRRNPHKELVEQRRASERNIEQVRRRLNYEQTDAARRVELQNKTLEMYETVRRNAAEQSKAESDDVSETSD
ncbi:MAG: hypothetical protein FWG48_04040 [Oscillospiraceae bacterium]|nr:hypothetical protein [Oscillospiraceae bacterium]